MTPHRPRLHLLGGTPEHVQDLVELLGDRYELAVSGEAAIGASDAELLLGALGESACLANADGSVRWSNALFDALAPAVREHIAEACRTTVAGYRAEQARRPVADAAMTRKAELVTPDERAFYDILLTVIADPRQAGPRPEIRVAVVVRDMTAARRIQQKMAAVERAGAELTRFDAEELRQLNSYQRLQWLEKKILRSMSELLNHDHFAIFLLDRDRKRLKLIMSAGLPTEIEDLDLFADTEGSGISGFVAATGQSYICHDATLDERYLPGLSGARSSLTVPLRVHDRVIGILDIESREPGQFDEQDRQFVEIFARHVAMALHTLDMLVAERCSTNQAVSGRFEGELAEPLQDMARQIEWLDHAQTCADPETARHIALIRADLEAIKGRMHDLAEGPQTLLGVERELAEGRTDPAMMGRRILIADDAPKIRKVIGEILRHKGCLVSVFPCGQEAIDELTTVSHDAYDLVISDIQMPDRNGYEVFSAARQHCPGVPVVLMTGFGYDPHHSIVRASQEGLAGVLFKPFEIEALLKLVHDALAPANSSS